MDELKDMVKKNSTRLNEVDDRVGKVDRDVAELRSHITWAVRTVVIAIVGGLIIFMVFR